jgi:hypothetical protein
VQQVNNTLRISLDGVANQSYRIEATDTLSPATWVPVGTVQASANGLAQIDTPLAPNQPMKFYRVVTQ